MDRSRATHEQSTNSAAGRPPLTPSIDLGSSGSCSSANRAGGRGTAREIRSPSDLRSSGERTWPPGRFLDRIPPAYTGRCPGRSPLSLGRDGMVEKTTARSIALLNETLHTLESTGIAHCLLRGPAPNAGRGRGSRPEADLLVDARDVELLGRVVEKMGFVAVPSRGHGSHRFYVIEDEASGMWLKLDVVTALRYGGRGGVLGSRAFDEVLSRLRRESGVPVLDPADAFLGLLLHCVLDKNSFREDHRRELARLGAQLEASEGSTRAQDRFRAALGNGLLFTDAAVAVRNGAWEWLLRRRMRIAWELARREPMGSLARWTRGKLSRGVHRFRSVVGKTLAISG